MPIAEPVSTAWLLVTVGLLLALSVLFSRAWARAGVPVFLLFLGVGVLAGSEGLGGIAFEDYRLSFRLGTVALVLILFDGGLNTTLDAVRRGVRPAAVLATVGVLLTAALMAAGGRLIGLAWPAALLVGATVASTDAAAVFSILRASGFQLKRRLAAVLELESGLNDPVAIILTVTFTAALASGKRPGWTDALLVPAQLAVGAALGAAFGYGGRFLLRRARLQASGLYTVLTLALAFLSFAVPTLLYGSGFIAVYIAGLILGNGPLPYRAGLLRFHDSTAWLSQVAMFLLLGLLVFPSHLVEVAGTGLALGLFLAFVARPLVVALCLAPFRFGLRETAFIGWVGLRGAVPIVLAAYPVMAQVPGAERLFDTVFFIVVVNAIVPGGTVPWLSRRLGLVAHTPPPPQAVLEIESRHLLDGEIVSYSIHPDLAVAGARLADIPLPERVSVMLVVRGRELIAPRGATTLDPGDHIYLVCRAADRPQLQLLFGRAEDD